jgi:ethanolamine utilization protein EutA
MGRAATLIGVDIGSTTTSAVVAEAHVFETALGGGVALSDPREVFRSPLVLTPLRDGAVDEDGVTALVDGWLAEAGVDPAAVFGGGIVITGLAARSPTALSLADRLRERFGRALVATARDPRFESWLAFMGNVSDLSRHHPDVPFLNLDIGGGTTNLALGQGGEVCRTGCLAIGARHVRVVPGSHRVVRLSSEVRMILDVLSLPVAPGEDLTPAAASLLLDVWTAALELAAAGGADGRASSPFGDLLVEAPLEWPEEVGAPAVVFSGGVGEVVYRMARGEEIPDATPYGDLGVELARRILRSPVLGAHVARWTPAGGGRAVAYGLLRHATEISGSTLHLPRPDVLPLCDLPILAALSPTSTDADLDAALVLARGAGRGACLDVVLPDSRSDTVRAMAERLLGALGDSPFPAEHPLVLLVSRNVGKALGAYLGGWGRGPHAAGIVVIDEVRRPDACFLQVGRPHDGIVPVSFHGMR